MAKVFRVFYTDNNENFGQVVEIAPSKRAVTKKYEEEQKEILKYIDITNKYTFTIDEVLAGNLTDEQRDFLVYTLKEGGVPYADDNNWNQGRNNLHRWQYP